MAEARPHEPAARVAFVSDIITPYMSAVFLALAQVTDLTVLYSAERGSRGAEWKLDPDPGFRFQVVGGAEISRGVDSTDYYPDPRLLRELRRVNPTGIVAGGFSFPTLYSAVYARLARIPLAIHSDGTSASESAISKGQRTTRSVLLRQAGAAVGNSAAATARFAELGVPEDRLLRANHTTTMGPLWAVGRSRSPREGGPLRVISVGRLIPRKGLDRLVQAVAVASERGTDVELTLVGSGPAEGDLRAEVARLRLNDRVRFVGFVDQPELPALYGKSDVFGFPTLDDPFGIVVLEAAAAGLAILGSEHGGATPELVRDGETGFRIRPENVEGMADRLGQLAADRAALHAMGQAAYRETIGRTPEAAAEAYVDAVRVAAQPGSAIRGRG